MRLTLLHNPSSGEERHSRDELESLAEAGHDVTYRSLKDDDWQGVLEQEAELIVVAGGDGSVRKLFTAVGASPTLVLILPFGSANNIARTLGLDLESAVGMLTQGLPHIRRPYNLWDVTSTWGTSRCVEALGGGVFPQVLAKAEDAHAKPSGAENVDFGLQLLAETLQVATPHRWRIELDGDPIEDELIGLEVMNIREIGPNLPFAPDADPGDGMLEVVPIRLSDRAALRAYVAARLRDEDVGPPPLRVWQGRSVLVEPPRDARLHVDDVLPAWDVDTPRSVEIVPAEVALEVLVPHEE